jgi:hypothetical protein
MFSAYNVATFPSRVAAAVTDRASLILLQVQLDQRRGDYGSVTR